MCCNIAINYTNSGRGLSIIILGNSSGFYCILGACFFIIEQKGGAGWNRHRDCACAGGARRSGRTGSARLMVLRAANGLAPNAPLPQVEAETRRYFEAGLVTGSFAAVLVFAGGELAATGGELFYEVMPTCHTPTGKKAYIMNMYTDPAWRRKGLATRVLDRLVRECRARGVDTITLEATAMGRPVYERNGFCAHGMRDGAARRAR